MRFGSKPRKWTAWEEVKMTGDGRRQEGACIGVHLAMYLPRSSVLIDRFKLEGEMMIMEERKKRKTRL
jgi:hypothetical protein